LAAEVLRYAAFTDDPAGGNPAGVVLDADGMSDDEMLAVAAEVGFSETAFVSSNGGEREFELRYFSPEKEIDFCGHATIAAAVAMGADGELVFHTRAGEVRIDAGGGKATLTSVEPSTSPLEPADLVELLAILSWSPQDLDPALPPRVAYAGVYHPVIAAVSRTRLHGLDYAFARLQRLMLDRDWTTVQLIHRESDALFHARDPFPPGGVVEDPATGAAAAAFGGYLRELGLIAPPADFTIVQGEDMGRRSVLEVRVRPSGGIEVSGKAVPL
jgi:PhzF family phenazine biosynthesis protein